MRTTSKKVEYGYRHPLFFIMQLKDEGTWDRMDPMQSEVSFVLCFAADRLAGEITDSDGMDCVPLPRHWTYG
jgi:hypothetical protein